MYDGDGVLNYESTFTGIYGFYLKLIWKKKFLTTFRYLPVMKEFTGTASVRLAELEDLFVDMKARVC